MNWIKRIKFILGPFWYRLFHDQDFLLGVEFLLGTFWKLTGYTLDNWIAGMFPLFPTVYPSGMPFVILLDVSTLHKEWYSWKEFVSYNGPVRVQAGHTIGSPTDPSYVATDGVNKGWVVSIVDPVPAPTYMMNHLHGCTLSLMNGPDFKFSDTEILFYSNPENMHIPSIKVTTADGELKIYWKLICVAIPETNDYPAVAGFMSPELNDCADVVWDIHQNGATYYNAKKLLAAATDNVVCDADGAINERWSEQGWNFIRVDDRIYKSRKSPNYSAGANVTKGAILFGDMKFYKGSQSPTSAAIPGIRVRTDAGELVAQNASMSSIAISGTTHYILPLTGEASVVAKYREICKQNSEDEKCPYIQVPSGAVNPYLFVMQTLRRGRTCAIRLTAASVSKLEAAIRVLRKSTNLGGLLTVYVKDSSDTANVTVSSFTADAGMGVVAVDATVTIQAQAAEARILP